MPFTVTIDKDADIEALNREQVRTALDERSLMLHNIFEEAGESLDPTKVKIITVKDGADLALQIRNRNEELTKLGKRESYFTTIDVAKAENDARRKAPAGADPRLWQPGNGPVDPPSKTFGELFQASDMYETAKQKGAANAMLDMDPREFIRGPQNATFLTSAGWAPESLRTGKVVLSAQRPIEVTDHIPMLPTTMAAVVFMEETTFTNAAAERAENASYVESALALTQRSNTVRSVGTSLPVTDEQLADVDGIAAYLDQRLTFMVRQRMDSQILVGDGIAPNLLGTLNVAGIQTQAKGSDPTPDAIYKAMILVMATGRAQPSVGFIHPLDWQDIRLLRTADGIYIWGSPADVGPDRIWGLPIVVTTAVTQNTGVVGDYANFAALYLRSGLEVQTGFVNNDFLQGRQTVRAGIRAAMVHYRPAAFCTITGI